MTIRMSRLMTAGFVAVAMAGCKTGEAAEEGSRFQTAEVSRGDLTIKAEATGTVEPVREVEVKSKASGEILRLHIDIGDQVEPGALLAEIDPRDVQNRYDQTEADLAVAQAQAEITKAQLDRSQALLDAEVITKQEHENARLQYANAKASLVRAQTNFKLAELQMNDVRIRAPMAGTIIQKNVEEGVVIQSASQNVSGGTTLFVMANLGEMQVRTLVDETDMGELRAGMDALVTVEAFPDRTFRGTVEKIEPQATVEQNVTMFPVIVRLDNRAGLLKPGMNAEVEIRIDQELDVLLVPNNAVVQPSDVGPAAMALGLDIESMDLGQFMRAGGRGRPGGRSQAGGARPGGDATSRPDRGQAGERSTSRQPGAEAAPGGDRAGGSAPGDARARIQELRAKVESGEISQDSLRSIMRKFRSGEGGAVRRGGAQAESVDGAPRRETHPAVVFVMGADSIPEPRLVQLGLGDWDNTQVVTGVEEGETLVIVGAAQLQAQQQEFLNRIRSRMGGSPFGGGRGRR
jgi:HlyD family secretion protein